MVKVRDFYGAVFNPTDYQVFLSNNIEHLQTIPMSKTFNTALMLAGGQLNPQKEPYFYIYRQFYLSHTSYGILAQISMEDYHNKKIKKHEKTLNRPNLNHKTYLADHVGPVVVSHRQDQKINEMILSFTKSQKAFSQWKTRDGRQHTLWKIKKSDANITKQFENIESLYILDGHHRLQAAHENYLLREQPSHKELWIQAIIYSSESVIIHPQHRVLQKIPENLQIINKLMVMDNLTITQITAKQINETDVNEQLKEYEIVLKVYEYFYGINFRNNQRNALDKVTTVRLQKQIFSQCLTLEMTNKLKYIPGIMEKKIFYQYELVFFVRETQIETLFQIADLFATMPPKSTWIQPKPCSHMVIRLME